MTCNIVVIKIRYDALYSNFSRHNIHGERTSPCRFCVDFERTGIKRWGFSERVRVNSVGFGAAHTHIGHLWEYLPPPPPGIINRFNIKKDRLLRYLATDKLSCDIHPRKMIKMVRRVSCDHIITLYNTIIIYTQHACIQVYIFIYRCIYNIPVSVAFALGMHNIYK